MLQKSDFLNMCVRQDKILGGEEIPESESYVRTRWEKNIRDGIKLTEIQKKINGDIFV